MSDREYLPSGAQLQARRLALGTVTQAHVAVLMRMSRAQVSQIEQGVATERLVRTYDALLDELESATT